MSDQEYAPDQENVTRRGSDVTYSDSPRAVVASGNRAGRIRLLAMPRRRGTVGGMLLVLLGIWGALIPFVGPYFHYQVGTSTPWAWSMDHLWFSVLPGVAVILGGLVLIGSANRAAAAAGSWLALLGGAWFVVGTSFSLLWSTPATGGPGAGSATMRFVEQIGYYYGLGVVITALAASALTRVLTRSERDAALLIEQHPDRVARVTPARDDQLSTGPGTGSGGAGRSEVDRRDDPAPAVPAAPAEQTAQLAADDAAASSAARRQAAPQVDRAQRPYREPSDDR